MDDSTILSIGLDHYASGYSAPLGSSIPPFLASYLSPSLDASTYTDFSSSLDAPSAHALTEAEIDLFHASNETAHAVEDEEAYDWGFPEDDSPFPSLSSSTSSTSSTYVSLVHFEPIFGSDSGSDSGYASSIEVEKRVPSLLTVEDLRDPSPRRWPKSTPRKSGWACGSPRVFAMEKCAFATEGARK